MKVGSVAITLCQYLTSLDVCRSLSGSGRDFLQEVTETSRESDGLNIHTELVSLTRQNVKPFV